MSTSPSNSPQGLPSSAGASEGSEALLPEDFQFSQGSLQDFEDCPRRFLLGRIEERPYPAAEAEPIRVNELRKERGVRFHELLCQACSGVPDEAIARQAEGDEKLEVWWERFTYRDPVGDADLARAELSLEGRVAGYPLTATYDLIAQRQDGTFEIFDWKTARHRPSRDQLASRLQTKVYPYLLVQAGRSLNGGDPIEPGQVKMTYWFARHPDDPETFEYSTYQKETGEEALTDLIGKILARRKRSDFEKTENTSHCRFCTYRSYCGRGTEAGNIEDGVPYLEDVESVETDLGDVEEVEF